jgi:anti-sigma-K factor RskA
MADFTDKISLMIPAYLQGKLSDEESLQIEELAAQDPAIAADIEFQRNLKSALKPDNNEFEQGELGWARLSKAMEAPSIAANDHSAKPKFWKYAAAILAVAAIGQAGILGSLALNDTQNEQYLTVSEGAMDAHTVKVGFYADVTERQLTEVLQSVEAKIVAGPSSLGLYDVQFYSKGACLRASEAFRETEKLIDNISACN